LHTNTSQNTVFKILTALEFCGSNWQEYFDRTDTVWRQHVPSAGALHSGHTHTHTYSV